MPCGISRPGENPGSIPDEPMRRSLALRARPVFYSDFSALFAGLSRDAGRFFCSFNEFVTQGCSRRGVRAPIARCTYRYRPGSGFEHLGTWGASWVRKILCITIRCEISAKSCGASRLIRRVARGTGVHRLPHRAAVFGAGQAGSARPAIQAR